MKIGFFNRIANRIDGEQNEKSEESSNGVQGKDGIDTEEILLSAIVQVFHKGYKGKRNTFDEKTFTLWIADQLLHDIIAKPEFQEQLKTRLDDEGYRETSWNSVRLETPPGDHMFTCIVERVFLQMEAKDAIKPSARKAKIAVVPGKGSLLQEMYLLDSGERRRYNIGVGMLPDMQGKSIRENHIAISDDVNSPQYENNKYVSRAHAHIGYSDKYGFYLQVETGGSRVYSGRTQIIRGDNALIEVENLELPIPLMNGDYIVLSKAVTLRFEEIANQ